jgi:citrate synthase
MSAAPRSRPVSRVQTDIASHDLHHIWVRGLDLTAEVMGQVSFGEMVFLLVAGRRPDAEELHLVDAMLVALVEHGLTPSAMVARVTYSVAPESLQGAVAAGLLGAGSVVLGSMEECGRLLTRVGEEVAAGADRTESITKIVGEYRCAGLRLPGIGHAIHTEGDPRAARLYALAEECGRRSEHLDALEELAALASPPGKQLPVNVTGAVAAILLELGVPWQLHRGFALISRSAGLVAHVGEELREPILPAIRRLLREDEAKARAGE